MAAALKRGECAAQAFVILICIILCFALRPPSVSGLTPMGVLSGSMSGQAEDSLEVGDLALIRRVEPDTLKVGDVVAYMSGGSAGLGAVEPPPRRRSPAPGAARA